MEPMDITDDLASVTTGAWGFSSSAGYSDTSESSTQYSSSPSTRLCSSYDPSEKPSRKHGPASDAAVLWSPQDEHFAQIFNDWDELPLPGNASWREELNALRALEQVIPPFEQAINYSDDGFAAWRLRHQAAMELSLTKTPGWPKYCNTRGEWLNDKWNERYRYLANLREQLIASRLHSLQTGLLRGQPIPRPARLISRMNKFTDKRNNRSVAEFWAQSVDDLLEVCAARRGIEAQPAIFRFWHEPPTSADLVMVSSDSDMSSPLSAPRIMHFEQRETQRETPAPAYRGTKGYPEVIKIESDSN